VINKEHYYLPPEFSDLPQALVLTAAIHQE
jgi:hypothetical protein